MVCVLSHGPNYRGAATCPECGAFLRYSRKDQDVHHEIRCPDCKTYFKVPVEENVNGENQNAEGGWIL